jgi:hypothetical protein
VSSVYEFRNTLVYRVDVKIPASQNSGQSKFQPVKIPASQNSSQSKFRPVKIPASQNSSQSKFRPVKIPASQNSSQSKFRPKLKNFLTFSNTLDKKQKKEKIQMCQTTSQGAG